MIALPVRTWRDGSIANFDIRCFRNFSLIIPARCQGLRIIRGKIIITRTKHTLAKLPRDFRLFLAATFLFGFSQSIVDSTFNNFLNETYLIDNLQRGILEIPRELPGLLVVAVSAIVFFCVHGDRQRWPISCVPSAFYSSDFIRRTFPLC